MVAEVGTRALEYVRSKGREVIYPVGRDVTMSERLAIKEVPAVKVVAFTWRGPHSDTRIRRELERLAKWAKERSIPTGNWYFLEPSEGHWEVAIELKGRAVRKGKARVRTLRACRVLYLRYNPDKVDVEALWKRLMKQVDAMRKSGRFARAGLYREVYRANPWTTPSAWAGMESQIVIHGSK